MWMPQEQGQYPAILVRTPYVRTWDYLRCPEFGSYFASRGYVFIVQDTRGRGDSEGEFDFFSTDGKDGYDSVEWIAAQPWSNGKVGMMGVSYLGTVQWMAAREKPPHLVCIAPTAAAGRWFEELPYQGGAFVLAFMLDWTNLTSGRIRQRNNAASVDWMKVMKHRPLVTMDDAVGRDVQLWNAWHKHPTMDDYWKQIQFLPEDFPKIEIPALHVCGWFDWDQPGALFYWRGMQEHSNVKDKQYLLVGPWTHPQTYLGGPLKIGEMEFPEDSAIDVKALHLAFFEHYLKGTAAAFDFPRARLYVTGMNEWRDYAEYPPAQMTYRKMYLHSGGHANTLSGDGGLNWEPPKKESPDKFTYDPNDPAPSLRPYHLGSDHRVVEKRDDVLVYTSAVLEEPLEVIGRVFVNLYASSDAKDTDFTAKILDVYPDGRSLKLGVKAAGILRARYRNGYEKTELLTPGKPELFRIELFDIGHVFLAGHRIRIEISSSCFPDFDPNTNTGNIVATDTEFKIAQQTVYHDSDRPSHVLLPVMLKPE
jgi:putative CocE/NonD family hydrolase